MKKMLITLCCIFSLCLISCASDKAAPEVTDEIITAPENTEEDQNIENLDSTSSQEDLFPEPEAFEEPEIITLEPLEIIEESASEKSENENSEIIEKEEPPAIIETVPEIKESDEAAEITEKPETELSEKSESETSEKQESENENSASKENQENSPSSIDITDDDSASTLEYEKAEGTVEVIDPSRSVTLKKFEYLDVTYPGTGWIFMGLTDNSKDIAYFGRKLGTKDTKFTLQARNSGKKIAHFYKNDPLSGNYIDDYIEINVLAESGSNKTHIAAPEYKSPVKKTEIQKAEPIIEESKSAAPIQEEKKTTDTQAAETKPAATQETKTSTKASTKTAEPVKSETRNEKPAEQTQPQVKKEAEVSPQTETSKPDLLLQEAQVLYNEKEFSAALKKINQFLEFAADNRDEGLYLKGQILEAKSDIRDIKGSLEAYSSLTKNYPASNLWESANKRIIYLKRFYLEVR